MIEGAVTPAVFRRAVLRWFDNHGRKHLPWQQEVTPYKVWLSEVMLQQTQVTTVLGYFSKFLTRFPDVHALAAASIDEVLHLWSGLGYYSRGRNLHRTAQILVERYAGEFPRTVELLTELPGIGRSTAGAILSLAHGERVPILDGNVKRVLARVFLMEGYPEQTQVNKRFWQLSAALLPRTRVDHFNQVMMDLGALICTRSKPQCTSCPCQSFCLAHQAGREAEFPHKKPRTHKPVKTWQMTLFFDRSQNTVLLERRPSRGIWGGLWCFPVDTVPKSLVSGDTEQCSLAPLTHSFTHFDLVIEPTLVLCRKAQVSFTASDDKCWYPVAEVDTQKPQLGLSVPVMRLVKQLQESSNGVLSKTQKRTRRVESRAISG